MPPEVPQDDHHLQRLRVGEIAGLVFGTFSDAVEMSNYFARGHPPV